MSKGLKMELPTTRTARTALCAPVCRDGFPGSLWTDRSCPSLRAPVRAPGQHQPYEAPVPPRWGFGRAPRLHGQGEQRPQAAGAGWGCRARLRRWAAGGSGSPRQVRGSRILPYLCPLLNPPQAASLGPGTALVVATSSWCPLAGRAEQQPPWCRWPQGRWDVPVNTS